MLGKNAEPLLGQVCSGALGQMGGRQEPGLGSCEPWPLGGRRADHPFPHMPLHTRTADWPGAGLGLRCHRWASADVPSQWPPCSYHVKHVAKESGQIHSWTPLRKHFKCSILKTFKKNYKI